MALSSTAKLQNRVIAKDIQQRRHVPYMDTTRGYGQHTRHGSPILIEENASRTIFWDVVFTQQINKTQSGSTITFQLTHNSTGMQMITTRQTQTLNKYTEMNTVAGVTVNYSVHCAVDVQQHTVLTTPLGQ